MFVDNQFINTEEKDFEGKFGNKFIEYKNRAREWN